jgi:hypothetical protein
MPGEVIVDVGSWVTLEANGASIANAAYAEADDAANRFRRVEDGGSRPHIEVELAFANSANASGSPFISIFQQVLNLFGGTDDAMAPSATNLRRFVLSEPTATGTTATQRMSFIVFDVPPEFSLWLQNGTGQAIAAGWTLRARGYTHKVA